MKKLFVFLNLSALSLILVSVPSFAGCGAIACNTNGDGACGVSYGWDNQAEAESEAMSYCGVNRERFIRPIC